jgi:glycosyltransferase involved in cell wall biosynthesis
MKIAFVGPFALQPKRTMAVRALPLAKALVARGHEVQMWLPPWDNPQDAGGECQDGGVQIHNVALPPRLPLTYHALLTQRLVRGALRGRPDVVHCFKPKAYAGLTAWTLWQLKRLGMARTRVVVDADDWEGPGGWNELQHYSAAEKRFFAWQERWGLRHNDALTVASRALESIAWSLGVPPAQVHYLPNGASATLAPSAAETDALRERYGLGNAPVALLYTRFFEYGVERGWAIMRGVLEQLPDVRWLVVGKGLFGEEKQLMELARSQGRATDVTYAGWVPPEALPAHFGLADVAIYPFDDTLVNRCKCAVKLIDLLAAGVAVVADSAGQNSEYIEHGVSGLLVTPGDTPAFVAAVVRLLRDADLARQLGRGAHKRIREHYLWERLASTAEQAYGQPATQTQKSQRLR